MNSLKKSSPVGVPVVDSSEAIEGKVAKATISPTSRRHNNPFDRLLEVGSSRDWSGFSRRHCSHCPRHRYIERRRLSFRTRIDAVNRTELRQLAEDRVLDAQALLDAGRWSGAYYLAGYAMECGLKACVLAHVEKTGAIFINSNFSKRCFTHDVKELIELCELKKQHAHQLNNARFDVFWTLALLWTEVSRYQQKTESEARQLVEAITSEPDGVLPWIRTFW